MEVPYSCSRSYIYPLLIMLAVAVAATSGGSVVELKAYEDGIDTHYVKPGQNTMLNCTFDSGDATVVAITNGTGRQILKWNIKYSDPEVLPDFKNRVHTINNNATDTGGYISFDFYYPYCHRDGVVKCEVAFASGDSYNDKKDFPIGAISMPVIKDTDDGNGTLLCIATRVAPQVTFEWSEGCQEIKDGVNEDVTQCLFNQTSHATCNVTGAETLRNVTCNITNTIGSECADFIPDSTGGGGGDDSSGEFPVWAIIVIVIASLVVLIGAAGVVYFIRKRRNEPRDEGHLPGRQTSSGRRRDVSNNRPFNQEVRAYTGGAPGEARPPDHMGDPGYDYIRDGNSDNMGGKRNVSIGNSPNAAHDYESIRRSAKEQWDNNTNTTIL